MLVLGAHPQRVRHRLLLLADLHAHRLCRAIRCRPDRRPWRPSHTGAGVIGALIVGVAVGALTLFVGQVAFASVRSFVLRAAIALLYAVPAAIAGYHAVLGLSQIGVPSLLWREVFAWTGALFIGGTAWARMSLFVPPFSGEALGMVRLSQCHSRARPGTW